MQSFEVGLVYKKGHLYYIAVSPYILVTFRNGEVVEVRPYSTYDVVRSISVDDLCGRWGIDLSKLDEMTSRYLPVPQDTVKPAPRGSRRLRRNEEGVWKEIRSGRLSKP